MAEDVSRETQEFSMDEEAMVRLLSEVGIIRKTNSRTSTKDRKGSEKDKYQDTQGIREKGGSQSAGKGFTLGTVCIRLYVAQDIS